MKLTKELAIVAKHIEKWFIPTPVNVYTVRYFSIFNTVYSDRLFTQDYTWDLLEKAFTYVEVKPWTLERITSLIKSVSDWGHIYLEDINTFDAVGNIAGINNTNYWIGIKELFDIIKLLKDKPYSIRVSSDWMIAFLDEDEVPLVIAWLYKMQQSLNLNNI